MFLLVVMHANALNISVCHFSLFLYDSCYMFRIYVICLVDVSQSLRLMPSDKDNPSSLGLCRSSGNLSKTSTSYLSSNVPSRHLRQSSADSAAIFHHHR